MNMINFLRLGLPLAHLKFPLGTANDHAEVFNLVVVNAHSNKSVIFYEYDKLPGSWCAFGPSKS